MVSDDHAGLKRAIGQVFCPRRAGSGATCIFLRNALDPLPRKANDDCLLGLRWLYDPRSAKEARRDLDVLERINQEFKRRTHVIRIFPKEASCLRLIRALAVEIHDDWIEVHRYLNVEALRDQRKADRQLPALAA